MMNYTKGSALVLALSMGATPAFAKDLEFKPLIDTRLRYESVEQAGIARDADAVTARMRAGFELKRDDFTFLAEAEATLAIKEQYNSTVNGLSHLDQGRSGQRIYLPRAGSVGLHERSDA